MNPVYRIDNLDEVFSPALVFYKSLIESNIAEIIRLAGSPARLCPHVKTHKTKEIAAMQLAAGITTHKCATVAEAEMLAQIQVPDILLAYPVIGPNVRRVRELAGKYPRSQFGVLCDHPDSAKALSTGFQGASAKLKVLMDIDVGHHRTGIAASPAAAELYALLATLPNLQLDGFHVYDGHNHQEELATREAAVRDLIAPVLSLRKQVEAKGIPVPRIICGGTPTFTVWAKMDFPGLQCSPGTFVLYDNGYGSKYKELSGLTPAAVVVSRLISKPMPGRLTFDLGHKAIAADPPAGKRCILLNLPEFTPILQNEEHFAIDTPAADTWNIGDVIYAVPSHVCPTVALHRRAYVVENNKVTGTWEIASRDRVLTV
ncbi:D-TA family PLP-dependent enzyme [Zavarzinella formosa]|uniref:D-TA family PLP-dependent enzyme n=1 Tax=Zavarzinella formosa TaxID=360055 RepID=UPI00030A0C59|nr:D-TA family PLP-dependent enzyme [Zavarzinella formosa]